MSNGVGQTDAESNAAVRQIVSGAVASKGMVHVFGRLRKHGHPPDNRERALLVATEQAGGPAFGRADPLPSLSP